MANTHAHTRTRRPTCAQLGGTACTRCRGGTIHGDLAMPGPGEGSYGAVRGLDLPFQAETRMIFRYSRWQTAAIKLLVDEAQSNSSPVQESWPNRLLAIVGAYNLLGFVSISKAWQDKNTPWSCIMKSACRCKNLDEVEVGRKLGR